MKIHVSLILNTLDEIKGKYVIRQKGILDEDKFHVPKDIVDHVYDDEIY